VSRVGEQNARAAAMLLLTLPGTAFIYQGDEIGMENGPGGGRPADRVGRDAFRHPMQWDDGPNGGFSTGQPWLAAVDPERRSVAAQREGPESVLALYRDLIAVRRSELRGPVEDLQAQDGVIWFKRGGCVVAVNTASTPRPAPPAGPVVLATSPSATPPGSAAPAELAPGSGFVARA
jgi:glycosidase